MTLSMETRRMLLQAATMVALELGEADTPERKREVRDTFDRLLDEEIAAGRENAAMADGAMAVLRAVNG